MNYLPWLAGGAAVGLGLVARGRRAIPRVDDYKRLWHGTSASKHSPLRQFKLNVSNPTPSGMGLWFTESREVAEGFAAQAVERGGVPMGEAGRSTARQKPFVIEANVRITNPKIYAHWGKFMADWAVGNINTRNLRLRRRLLDAGYDGFRLDSGRGYYNLPERADYVAFAPAQVHNVTWQAASGRGRRAHNGRRAVWQRDRQGRQLVLLHGTRIYWSDLASLWSRFSASYTREEALQLSKEIIQQLQELSFPLQVWRGLDLFASDPVHLENGGGSSWSPDRRSAANFGTTLLAGVLPTSSGVDWNETVYRRIRYDFLDEEAWRMDPTIPECEVVVKRGAVKEVRVVVRGAPVDPIVMGKYFSPAWHNG